MASNLLPILTTSERSCFKRCPQKWWWRYRDGFLSPEESADALWFGIGVHEALAQWYKKGKARGVHPAKYFRDWVGDEMREIRAQYANDSDGWTGEPLYVQAGQLGEAMLDNYVLKYGRDPGWRVIATEQQFSVNLSYHGKVIGTFKSTFDGVYYDEEDGRYKLMEHKTAGSIQTAYLELDDQGGSYFAVASAVLAAKGLLPEGCRIEEITYNFLRKTEGDDRPQNELGQYLNNPTKDHYVAALTGLDGWTATQLKKMTVGELDSIAAANHLVVQGEVSKKQPPPSFLREPVERGIRDGKQQMRKIADEMAVMLAMRDGAIPVFKTPTKDCPRCEFFHMCTLHDRGGDDWKELAAAEYYRADPYERYTIKSASA
jgi:hypothetical protein